MKTGLIFASLHVAVGLRKGLHASTTSKGCLDLLVLGDFGSKGPKQESVADGMAKVAAQINPAAVLALGDNIYEVGALTEGQMVSDWKDIWLSRASLQLPWYAVTGNHDWYVNGRTQRGFTTNPESGGFWQMPEFWHSKKWGDVEAFFIDSQIWRRNVPTMWARVREQRRWLESSLQNSTAAWKIVVGHHPVWSVGKHGGSGTMKREVDPMMRQFGATIHLAGHDHSLQHIAHKNVNYIISGSGSKSARSRSDDLPSPGSLKAYQPDVGFASLQFCDTASATLKFYSASGDTIYSAQLANDQPSALEEVRDLGMAQDEATCHGVEMRQVDLRCAVDGCTVQADINSATTSCEQYCHTQGLQCIGAWLNEDEDCAQDRVSSCSALGDGLFRQVCQCT